MKSFVTSVMLAAGMAILSGTVALPQTGGQAQSGETGQDNQSGDEGQSGDQGESGETGQTGDQGQSGEEGQSGELGQNGDSGSAQDVNAVSAASFSNKALAPASLATLFGKDLTDRVESASQQPWPVSLAGISVELRPVGNSGAPSYQAPLAFASPTQVNFLIPTDIPDGKVEISVIGANGHKLKGVSRIERLAPGLFHAGSDLQGFAAAVLIRVHADGTQTREPLVRFDPKSSSVQPVPIRFTSHSERLFLELYGTGLRNSVTASVTVRIHDQNAPVRFAGPHPTMPGLDQVDVELPSSLSGTKEGRVQMLINKKTGTLSANEVKLIFDNSLR